MDEAVQRCRVLSSPIRKRFKESFWSDSLGTYRFTAPGESERVRSDLCTNCWALLADIVPPEDRQVLLDSVRRHHWREGGSVNVAPVYEEQSAHNNSIWAYSNAYEVTARLHCGDVEGALELFRRYINLTSQTGHPTLFEMVNLDGSLPILSPRTGNTLSFAHCWGAQGSWAMQRYLLGVKPEAPGWKRFSIDPLPAPSLSWVRGAVPTPEGTIEVELEKMGEGWRGKALYPHGLKPVGTPNPLHQIELVAK